MTKAERAEFKQLMTEVFEAKLEPYLNAINTDLLHQARRISYIEERQAEQESSQSRMDSELAKLLSSHA